MRRVTKVGVDVAATPKEKGSTGTCGVSQISNARRDFIDTPYPLRPSPPLTNCETTLARGGDFVPREGHHLEWWCYADHRGKSGVSLMGGTRTP